MNKCPYEHRCPYFKNAVAMPLVSWETLVNAYCLGNIKTCARFLVYSELDAGGVPSDLRPDQNGRAHEILSCSFYGY